VDSKYGNQWGGWCSNQVREPHGVSLWKFIRAGWDSFVNHTSLLLMVLGLNSGMILGVGSFLYRCNSLSYFAWLVYLRLQF
jgi:hypothetical protein